MGIAAVVRRFGKGMQVVDTLRERDVEVVRDYFTPMTRGDSKGIWVVVK